MYGGAGIHISLFKKDKYELREKGNIEAIFENSKIERLRLCICDHVQAESFEEHGIHAGYIKEENKYLIKMDKIRFDKLTGPIPKGEINNHFATRSEFDRISILYWGV